MDPNIVALLYLAAGVLFILALRGLSSPESSRMGNIYGMIGMTIAVVTTLLQLGEHSATTWGLIIAGVAIGGGIGAYIAQRIPMTVDAGTGGSLPLAGGSGRGFRRRRRAQRTGCFRDRLARRNRAHLAAGNVARHRHRCDHVLGLGDRLRQALGSHVGGTDHPAGAAHGECRLLALLLVVLVYYFCMDGGPQVLFWLITILALLLGRSDHHPDRRRRHAGGRVDAELLLGLGGRRHRLHARQHRADHHRRARRLVGRDPVLHHVQGHEPLVHLGDPRRLRR